MRILIAGGTGVIGRALIPALTQAGHEPTALAQSTERATAATEAGARFVQADALEHPVDLCVDPGSFNLHEIG